MDKACKNGHISARRQSDNRCIECCRLRSLRSQRLLKAKDPDYYKKRRLNNIEKELERERRYRKENITSIRKSLTKWQKANKGKVNFHTAKRRAILKKATPSWLSPIHWNEILHIYISCPDTHQVDHIEPLQGINVCGLHVPWNLRHLPIKENQSKGNRC